MAQFSVNANLQRFDPYNNFKFLVKWDGKYVAGVSKVTALKRSTKPAEHREGGDHSSNRKSPGRTTYDAVTLEKGCHSRVQSGRLLRDNVSGSGPIRSFGPVQVQNEFLQSRSAESSLAITDDISLFYDGDLCPREKINILFPVNPLSASA